MPSLLGSKVQSLHNRVVRLDQVQSTASFAAMISVAVAVAVGMDHLIRWPWFIRVAIVVTGLTIMVRVLRQILIRSWIRAPSVQSVAIRMEEVEPSLRDTLASAIDFQRDGIDKQNAMAQQVVQSAEALWDQSNPYSHVRSHGAIRSTLALAACAGAWAVAAAHDPVNTMIGLRRTITPWSADQWPALVSFEVDTASGAVARGASVPLRVRITRGDLPGLRVSAVCTITEAHGKTTDKEFDLMRQTDGSFERPTIAEGESMAVKFLSRDAITPPITLQVVTAPAIVSGTINIQPPTYAAPNIEAVHGVWQGVEIRETGTVLAGSTITMELDLAAPAPWVASDSLGVKKLATQVIAVDMNGVTLAPPTITAENPSHWIVKWVADQSVDVTIRPTDSLGVSAPEPLRIPVRVSEDREPTVVVTEPESDQTVTTQATIPFHIDARDDIGLQSIGWRLDRQQRSGEPSPTTLVQGQHESVGREDSIKGTLKLASMSVKAGDLLLLRGVAHDRYQNDQGLRAPTIGEARQLRVVDRDIIEKQIRQQANMLRQAVSRLEAAQQEIAKEQDPAASARSQAGLAERIRQTTAATERLTERLANNDLQELALAETLQEAERLGVEAGSNATGAHDALRRAGEPEFMEQAKQLQHNTEQALHEIVEILDRDDDTAGAQKRADRLAETIAKLRSELQDAAKESSGKAPDELSTQEEQSLRGQAAKQRSAADEVRALLDELHSRADKAQETDKQKARSLRQAAEQGEKGQVARRMDEAADRTEKNQATAADESMEAAAKTVEQIRSALREDRRAQAESLRRRLASLAETLKALVTSGTATTHRIDGLDGNVDTQRDPIANELLQLSRNVSATAVEAKESDRSLSKVGGILDRSTERFDAAVGTLRADPADIRRSHEASARGTELLREALREVEAVQKKESSKASERERKNLSKTYAELATQTRSIRDAVVVTIPPAGTRLDRRGAATQREQSLRAQELLRAFRDGPKSAELVSEVNTFKAIHDRIDHALQKTSSDLEGSAADNTTIRHLDSAAASLDAIAVALTDPEQGDDPFADGKDQSDSGTGGAGGGGSPEGGLPPIAELRLVRQMQAHVNQLTKALDTAQSDGKDVAIELGETATMQDEIRRLGEDWIERMKEKMPSPGANKPISSGSPTPNWNYWLWRQAASDPQEKRAATTTTTTATEPATTTTPPAKTLDELLGLEAPKSKDGAAQSQRNQKLEKSLKEEDLNDLAKSATESMELSTRLVREQKDVGIGTQRVQAEALANLDALLDAATRFQKQQQKSGKSSSSSQGKPTPGESPSEQSQESGEDGQPKPGSGSTSGKADGQKQNQNAADNSGDQVDPPPPEDASMAASGVLEEGRSEWGRLPQRIREIMSQARRDRISAIYQQATEAYYRRMAEDRAP